MGCGVWWRKGNNDYNLPHKVGRSVFLELSLLKPPQIFLVLSPKLSRLFPVFLILCESPPPPHRQFYVELRSSYKLLQIDGAATVPYH
jgi:hypothetical protein